MNLYLVRLPETLRGPADEGYHGQVPERTRMLMPDAAASLLTLEEASGGLVYTDLYRSAQAQLVAHRLKRGTQPVAYSAHGYGFAADLDVDTTLRLHSMDYLQLVEFMGEHGWYCHRRDLDPLASESWHFNYLGEGAADFLALADETHATWAKPAEARIEQLFGSDFAVADVDLPQLLLAAGIQGVNPDSPPDALKAAIEIFQRQWDLSIDGVAGPITRRTLAYVTATVNVT